MPKRWLSIGSYAVARVASGEGRGVGFVLGAGAVGRDLDHCINGDCRFDEIASRCSNSVRHVSPYPVQVGVACMCLSVGQDCRVSKRAQASNRRSVWRAARTGALGWPVTLRLQVDCNGTGIGGFLRGPQAQAALDAFIGKWSSQEWMLAYLQPNDAWYCPRS